MGCLCLGLDGIPQQSQPDQGGRRGWDRTFGGSTEGRESRGAKPGVLGPGLAGL